MNTLIVATSNKDKLKEIKQLLKDIPFEIKSLKDIGFNQEIPETGTSFQENAEIKASAVAKITKILTLAEDSGLEVEYLGGRPGIYSARYVPGSDMDRVHKVLEELKSVPQKERTAKFICVAALFNPETGKVNFFNGESFGFITDEPIGKNGFGYDPIFYNSDLKKTNGEASEAEKNSVSHRARAILKLKNFLGRGAN